MKPPLPPAEPEIPAELSLPPVLAHEVPGLGAIAPGQRISSGPASQGVVAAVSAQPVVARATVQLVLAGAGVQRVVAGTAREPRLLELTLQPVCFAQATQVEVDQLRLRAGVFRQLAADYKAVGLETQRVAFFDFAHEIQVGFQCEGR